MEEKKKYLWYVNWESFPILAVEFKDIDWHSGYSTIPMVTIDVNTVFRGGNLLSKFIRRASTPSSDSGTGT